MNQQKNILGLLLTAVAILMLGLTLRPAVLVAGDNLDSPDAVLEQIYDLYWDARVYSGLSTYPDSIPWFHDSTGMPGGLDQGAFETAVETSFNTWEAVDDGLVQEPLVPRMSFGGATSALSPPPSPTAFDGINVVSWIADGPSGLLAVAPCYKLSAPTTTALDTEGNTVMNFSGGVSIPFPGPPGVTYPKGILLDCGIQFDNIDPWSTSGGSGFDVQSVATHEIGHFLGLSHSTVGNLAGVSPNSATMIPFGTSANTDLRSLQEDDAASLLRTYARNANPIVPQTVGGRGVIQFNLAKGGACEAATGVSVWAYRTSEGLLGATRVETFSGSEYRVGNGDEPRNGSVTLNVPPVAGGDTYTIFARTLENDNTSGAGAFSAYRYNYTTINSNSLEPTGQSQTFDNLAVVGPIADGETVDLGTIGIQGCWNPVPGSEFDLTGDSVTAPAQAVLGGQIAVTSSLSNVGTATTGQFEAGIYFSTDTTINAADVFTGFTCDFPAGLAGGAGASCDGTVNVPSLVAGTYYVGLLVDRSNDVGESDESNNGVASVTTIDVQPNPLDPLANGSFETGDLSGWTVKELDQTSSNPFLKLTVDGAGVAYPAETFIAWPYVLDYFNSEPTDGQYAALHDWNGNDTTTSSVPDVNLRELYQDVTLPAEATTLTFDYRAAWELFRFGNTLPRTFSVRIEPAGGGAPLIDEVILVAELGIEEDTDNPSGPPGQSYPPGIVDISGVAGQDVRVKFVWDVPEPGKGFAFFQLDNIRVNTLPNDAPIVSITSPGDGTNFTVGDSIDFAASASDTEDGDVSASLAWSSNVDGPIGTDAAFSFAGLSVGPHLITATATDSAARPGSSSVSVTIDPLPNTAPVVSITSPSNGATFSAGEPVLFAATATDDPDGDISGSLSWTSDLAGAIGSGASFSTSALGAGTHLITASVTDAGGLAGSDYLTITVETAPPAGDIVNPATADFSTARGQVVSGSYADTAAADGSVETLREQQVGGNPRKARSQLDHTWTFTVQPGNSYSFHALASRSANAEGDDFTLAYSLDNSSFTTMGTVNSDLLTEYQYDFPGTVAGTVYVRIQDTDDSQGNAQLDEVSIDWMAIVSLAGPGGNSSPNVTITAPTNGTSVTIGTSITFAGTASDSDDGDLSAGLAWVSSIDGSIGSGAGFPTTGLSAGTHTVTASVTDSGGLSGSAVVTVTVNPAGDGDPISLLSANGYKVKGIQTVDLTWSGATSVDVYRDSVVVKSGAGGSSYTDSTGAKGGGQTYVYQVCEAGAVANCSNSLSVSF